MQNITIYRAVSALHSPEAVEAAHAAMLGAIKEKFNLTILPLEDLPGDEKIVYLFVATGGVEEGVRAVLENRAPDMVYLLADGLQNSLAASMEISAWLSSRGIASRILHGSAADIAGAIEGTVLADALAGARVGVIHEPSGWLISSNVDYRAVQEKYGVDFVRVPLEEIEKEYASASPATVDGIKQLRRVEPSEKDVDDALRLTAAVETVVEKNRLDAFTLKCFDLLDSLHTTGCLALAVLNARGIPAGCEGDVPALMTMLLSQRLTGAPGFMANPSRIDSHTDTIILAHCTLPMDMAGENILRTHFESSSGVALQGILPTGPVTVVKWWGKNLEHAFVASGTLEENLDNPSMCRTQVRIRLNRNVSYFLDSPLGNHHIVLLGDHTEVLTRFFAAHGVEIK